MGLIHTLKSDKCGGSPCHAEERKFEEFFNRFCRNTERAKALSEKRSRRRLLELQALGSLVDEGSDGCAVGISDVKRCPD
jgi:hypothetical protein